MVAGYDAAHVYTVEGNTGYSAGYTGGAVLERTYSRGDSRIVGYGVPRWSVAGGSELEVDGGLGVQSVTVWRENQVTLEVSLVLGLDKLVQLLLVNRLFLP